MRRANMITIKVCLEQNEFTKLTTAKKDLKKGREALKSAKRIPSPFVFGGG